MPDGGFVAIEARFWRMLSVRWQREPLSGAGAALTGGRWNRPGQPALYLSADHPTAVLEFHQNLVRPGTLTPYDVVSPAIVDLTLPDAVPDADLFAEWRRIVTIDHSQPPGWDIADQLLAQGAHGVLVPSAQHRGGINLVLWRWNDASDDGAAVGVIDPRDELGRRG